MGGTITTSYKYEGLKVGLDGRGLLGFKRVVSQDNQTGISSSTEYSQTFPTIGMPLRSEQRLANNHLLASTVNTPAAKSISHSNGASTFYPYVSNNVEKRYHLNNSSGTTSLLSTATTTSNYDSYGNPLTINISRSGNGETFTKSVANTYTNNTTDWCLGRLSRTEVTSTAHNQAPMTRTSAFEYDGGTGVLNKEIIEPDSADESIRLTTVYTHDGYGNRTSSTVCSGDSTACVAGANGARISYDGRGQFPMTTTNALGHSETKAFDARFGVLTSLTGPNGLTTTWSHDSLGRKTGEQRADGTNSTITRSWCDASAGCPNTGYYKVTAQSSGSGPLVKYFDQHKREIRSETVGFDGSKIYVDIEYDNRGRMKRKSEPYFSGAGTIYWPTPRLRCA